MTIDFHTHCFPDKISKRALEALSYAAGGLEFYTDGTCDGILSSMKKENIDISVVLNIATNERQQENVNNFAAQINEIDGIIAFGSVYPRAESALYELERIKSLGLKGVKLHPEYQNFYVDEGFMKDIYKKISELGLILVFHSGVDYGYSAPYHCMPDNLVNALKWIDFPVVAAHWGGAGAGPEVVEKLCGLDLYFDTAFGYGQMPKYIAQKIIDKHGTEKILFATDSPWHTASMEKRLLDSLQLSDDEYTAIYSKNAKKLLGI